MANRIHRLLETVKDKAVLLTAKLTGGGVGLSLVNADSANQGAGEVVSAVWSATGKYTVTFRHAYFELLAPLTPCTVGTTDGLVGQYSAFNPVTKTAALELYVGSTPTDAATTDTIFLTWIVRNSGRNQ